jgi:hypothetical protein
MSFKGVIYTPVYLPIQKLANMFPRRSSEVISPVISPK